MVVCDYFWIWVDRISHALLPGRPGNHQITKMVGLVNRWNIHRRSRNFDPYMDPSP